MKRPADMTDRELAAALRSVQLRGNTPPHLVGLLDVVAKRLMKERGDE